MREALIRYELEGGPPTLLQQPGQAPPPPFAVWWDTRRPGLAIALHGSTSHPAQVVGWTLLSDQTIELHISREASPVISLDHRVSTKVIEPPPELDPTRPATAVIEGHSILLQPLDDSQGPAAH